MSQELAQDENEADDYEFGSLERRPVQHENDDEDMDDEQRGFISNGRSDGAEDGFKSENVVFALEDSDDEGHHARRSRDGFRDEEEAAEAEGDVGRTLEREKGKLD
jgi:hypothetical protein